MDAPSTLRRVRLRDYVIEQRCGADRGKQIDIYSKVYSGELKAVTTSPSVALPTSAGMASVLRHAMSVANDEREVPALSVRKIKDEIGKAAAGRDAAWQVIDNLILLVPGAAGAECVPAEQGVPAEVTAPMKRKAKSVNDDRAEIILKAIAEAGIDRYAINKPPKGKREGDRSKVWRKVPPRSMEFKEFENAWEYMLDKGIISYKIATLTA